MKNSIAAFAALGLASAAAATSVADFGDTTQRSRRDTIKHHTVNRTKRTKKPEEMYASLIKAGLVKVVRRKGKPPAIIWL